MLPYIWKKGSRFAGVRIVWLMELSTSARREHRGSPRFLARPLTAQVTHGTLGGVHIRGIAARASAASAPQPSSIHQGPVVCSPQSRPKTKPAGAVKSPEFEVAVGGVGVVKELYGDNVAAVYGIGSVRRSQDALQLFGFEALAFGDAPDTPLLREILFARVPIGLAPIAPVVGPVLSPHQPG